VFEPPEQKKDSEEVVADDDKKPKTIEEDDDEVLSYDPGETPMGCCIFGKYPITALLGFVVLGLIIGIGLSYWRPETSEEEQDKAVAIQWLGLIGVLFLRALKCIVLPIVFVNVILAVLDMMSVGAAGGVGGNSVLLYLCTTVLAGILGVVLTLIFKRWYTVGTTEVTGSSYVQLGCTLTEETDADAFLVVNSTTGEVVCESVADYTEEMVPMTYWEFHDVNNTFVTSGGGVEEVSLSDTIYDGVFMKLITDNIFKEFVDMNFAAIVIFAIAMGVATSKVVGRMVNKNQLNNEEPDLAFVDLLVELDRILGVMIIWVIMCTPFAVCSMIISAIGEETDLAKLFAMVGLLMGCTWTAFILQYLLVYCGGYALLTRRNPFAYTKALLPAQIMAFASASSAATIPVSISSVMSSGHVSETIARFVIPLGATVNMDGGAIYFPCACIWLAVYNGMEITAASYILLVILATFGSMGTAPVPNASLALIMTAYNTCFNTTGEPDGFGYIFAVDWFMDRGRTLVNVTGDCFVCGTISHICPLDGGVEEDLEEEMRAHSQSQLGFGVGHSQRSSFEYATDHFGVAQKDLYNADVTRSSHRLSGSLRNSMHRNVPL
jgi:Na+/H+-dicarboxylate symporter